MLMACGVRDTSGLCLACADVALPCLPQQGQWVTLAAVQRLTSLALQCLKGCVFSLPLDNSPCMLLGACIHGCCCMPLMTQEPRRVYRGWGVRNQRACSTGQAPG
jgi:hypothetical protein